MLRTRLILPLIVALGCGARPAADAARGPAPPPPDAAPASAPPSCRR
ncbi:MAG: hypothetical protein H6704_09470 [Myxococcales bacterium]|nr:hypothetical protein [Myxococcales bacterium]